MLLILFQIYLVIGLAFICFLLGLAVYEWENLKLINVLLLGVIWPAVLITAIIQYVYWRIYEN